MWFKKKKPCNNNTPQSIIEDRCTTRGIDKNVAHSAMIASANWNAMSSLVANDYREDQQDVYATFYGEPVRELDTYITILQGASGTSAFQPWLGVSGSSEIDPYRMPILREHIELVPGGMIMVCERCGTRYLFDKTKLPGVLTKLACLECGGSLI